MSYGEGSYRHCVEGFDREQIKSPVMGWYLIILVALVTVISIL